MRAGMMVAAVLVLCAGAARAGSCLGVDFPASVTAGRTTLALNGMGVRRATIFAVDVYVAGLYVPKRSGDPAAVLAEIPPGQLVLHFVRGASARQIRDAWQEGFETNAGAQLEALRPRITALDAMMEDVTKGEEMRFTFTGAGVAVALGRVEKGVVPGVDFSRVLLSIWLGARPPNAAMKSGLLGGECS